MISAERLARLQAAIASAGVDGWLLYDFRCNNPIAGSIVGIGGMLTRRYFCYIPAKGSPVAITHSIEQVGWREWSKKWENRVYSSWRDLERNLSEVVGNRTVAMEYSPGDAVPYLDRVPGGVIDMVRAAGATVVTSADLVSRFHAVWTPDQLASHERAAEHLMRIVKNAFALAGERATAKNPMREHELVMLIREEFAEAGLETADGPNISVGPNAADPHYEPSAEGSSLIERGSILLIDLWAREPNGVYADQCWVASLGEPSQRDVDIWAAVRGARDAAISFLRDRLENDEPVRGGEVDDVARNYVTERGFGKFFTHRTGHSIDSRELHGSGPHLDNLESRDERLLIPGVGFSIEPGVYLPNDVGMRCEVNGLVTEHGLIVTPSQPQHDLIIV